jgi:transglutaminase-like putative cysteine protease
MHELNIQASSVVEAASFNPFNFLVSPAEFLKTPFSYSATQSASLNAALSQTPISYGEKLLIQTKHHTVNFVIQLTRQIHNDFLIEERLLGSPHPPDTTFEQKKGSCRDVSWMQIQLLRHFGIAARFVSGYYFIDEEITEF